MNRYEVTLLIKGGKVQHVVKADDAEAAGARGRLAYPGSTVVATKLLGEAFK